MAQTGDSSTILQEILGETRHATEKVEARVAASTDIGMQIDEVQKQFEEAAKIRDERQRKARERVLTTTLEQLRANAAKEQEDLAKAVFGLNAFLEKLGDDYKRLGELNVEEKKLIADAEIKLNQAQEALIKAKQKWVFKQSAIDYAKQQINTAEHRVSEAVEEARRRARQRLLSANIEQALQQFQLWAEKTVRIMEARKIVVNEQINVIALRKTKAFQIKEEAARALEKLDNDLDTKEAELKSEEDKLNGLENGSPEHAEQTQLISNLRAKVEELRGKRNTALILFQSKEKYAAELEVHEQTHRKLHDNLMMWITGLRSDTEERVVTFKSRLEAQKAVADQDVAKQLDELGAEVDQRNLEFMAAAGAASDRLRMEKIERHPERIKDVAAIQAAQAEAVARIREREQKMIEYFKETYGVDPTSSSFFHYAGKEQTE